MVSDETRLANREAILERSKPVTPNAVVIEPGLGEVVVDQDFVDVTAHTGSASLLPIIGKKGTPKDLLSERIGVSLKPEALKELGLEALPQLDF